MSKYTSTLNPETIANALASAKDRGRDIKEEVPDVVENTAPKEELFKGARADSGDALKLYPYDTAAVMRHRSPQTEEQIKNHARAHEYITVVLQSHCYGSSFSDVLPLKFMKNATIYDPITFWEIPVGIKVAVPRWVAEHVNAHCKRYELVCNDKGDLGEHGTVSGRLKKVDKGDFSYKFVCA